MSNFYNMKQKNVKSLFFCFNAKKIIETHSTFLVCSLFNASSLVIMVNKNRDQSMQYIKQNVNKTWELRGFLCARRISILLCWLISFVLVSGKILRSNILPQLGCFTIDLSTHGQLTHGEQVCAEYLTPAQVSILSVFFRVRGRSSSTFQALP